MANCSWLPRQAWNHPQESQRSASRDAGPRSTRSPTEKSRSTLGSNPVRASRASRCPNMPWISPTTKSRPRSFRRKRITAGFSAQAVMSNMASSSGRILDGANRSTLVPNTSGRALPPTEASSVLTSGIRADSAACVTLRDRRVRKCKNPRQSAGAVPLRRADGRPQRSSRSAHARFEQPPHVLQVVRRIHPDTGRLRRERHVDPHPHREGPQLFQGFRLLQGDRGLG